MFHHFRGQPHRIATRRHAWLADAARVPQKGRIHRNDAAYLLHGIVVAENLVINVAGLVIKPRLLRGFFVPATRCQHRGAAGNISNIEWSI